MAKIATQSNEIVLKPSMLTTETQWDSKKLRFLSNCGQKVPFWPYLIHFTKVGGVSYFEFPAKFEISIILSQDDLLSVENQKYTDKSPVNSLFPSGGETARTIFMLDKSDFLMCLPLKTGTTNWQRTLVSIMAYESSGEYLG